MMKRRELLGAALLAPLAACSAGMGDLPPIRSASREGYLLGSGDELRLSVFGFDQMAGTYIVSDQGSISLPMLGTVPVAEQSAPQAEQTIAGMLRTRDLAPDAKVSVQVTKYRPFYILGEVQRPGQYPFVPGMTVTNAVAIAGGYTYRANKRSARVRRTVQGSITQGAAGPDTVVQPGDTILVPEAWF